MTKSTYLEELDRWLKAEIDKFYEAVTAKPITEGGLEGFDAFRKAIRAKVVESYRNGQRSRARREPGSPEVSEK